MKRIFLLLLLSVLVLPQAALAQTEEELFDFEGFDYESPDANPSEFGDVGDWYNAYALCQSVNASYITADFVANEYTTEFFNLPSLGYTDFGGFRFVTYGAGGMINLYEDSRTTGTAADFGVTPPPNGTTPSTFNDGTLILGGSVSGFVITLDLANGTGSFTGDVTFNAGTQVGNIPESTTRVYTFAGLTSGEGVPSPADGYIHQITGSVKIELPVQTHESTWGRIKALTR